MLSHELRNPLAAILNGIGVLDHFDADRREIDRAGQAIRRQVQHMSRLLDDLLDLARITQGKIGFRKQILNLNDLLGEAARAVQPAIETRRQSFAIIPASEPVIVEGDPTRLLQVVDNLLTNASKYTPPNGSIAMELKEKTIASYPYEIVAGIPPICSMKSSACLFSPTTRSTEVMEEWALDLRWSAILGFASWDGDRLQRRSRTGIQFVVRLPLTSQPLLKSTIQVSGTTGMGIRVLLVEDNPDSREMLQTILRLDGFQVECAADGQQGLARYWRTPDVAVIDIGLPKIDGYEVAGGFANNSANRRFVSWL